MAAVASTGIISLPLQRLREFVARSAIFQGWVGAGDEAAALKRVYRVVSDVVKRPYAIVGFGGQLSFSRREMGHTAASFEAQSGQNRVTFEADLKSLAGDALDDQVTTFTNTIGAIIEEFWQQGSEHPDLAVTRILAGDVRLSSTEEKSSEGRYLQQEFVLAWQGEAS